MDKRIQSKAGFVCINCGHRYDVILTVNIDTVRKTPPEDVKAWIYPEFVQIACPKCGHSMFNCDPDLAGSISRFIRAGYHTKFSCQGHYKLDEYFDNDNDFDILSENPRTETYHAEMAFYNPYIVFDLTENDEKESAKLTNAFLKEIDDWAKKTAIKYGKYVVHIKFEDPFDIDEVMLSVDDDHYYIKTHEHTEWKEIAGRADIDKTIKRFGKIDSLQVHRMWPDRETFDSRLIPTIGKSMTDSFIRLLDRVTVAVSPVDRNGEPE